MKRLLQTVAVLVASVLAVQPALAALACSAESRCPMAMSEMGPDCPMAHSLEAANCSPDCCDHSTLGASQSWVTLSRPKNHAVDPAPAAGIVVFSTPAVGRGILPDPATQSSPPRYILHQVFRI